MQITWRVLGLPWTIVMSACYYLKSEQPESIVLINYWPVPSHSYVNELFTKSACILSWLHNKPHINVSSYLLTMREKLHATKRAKNFAVCASSPLWPRIPRFPRLCHALFDKFYNQAGVNIIICHKLNGLSPLARPLACPQPRGTLGIIQLACPQMTSYR